MLDFDEALAILDAEAVTPVVERLAPAAALGRVLAEPVSLARDQPGFDRATMDGYALCLEPGRADYEVVATVDAGVQFEGALSPGQAVRIMTGAPCPAHTTVVKVEDTDGGTQRVQVQQEAALQPGRNIAWRGEDGRAGDTVLEAGTRLSPSTLSAAAMAGARELAVYAPPRLGLVSTGDEVGGEGVAGIADSNGPLLSAFAAALGCPFKHLHAPDEAGALRAAMEAAGSEADIVVTVGGVSMGRKDLVPAAADALGYRTLFHKVAIQPGKPVLAARHPDGRWLLGLPGNPVSVLVTAQLFLARVIGAHLGGWRAEGRPLPLAVDHEHRGRRRLFLPTRWTPEGLVPVKWNGSGDLLAAATADGLIDLAPGSRHAAGELMGLLPFAGHLTGEVGRLPPRDVEPGAHC